MYRTTVLNYKALVYFASTLGLAVEHRVAMRSRDLVEKQNASVSVAVEVFMARMYHITKFANCAAHEWHGCI
jgi:hypothetical protein